MTEEQLALVAKQLSAWYDQSGRRFPWRFKGDSYHVLATEFILQRTRASVANQVYEAFFEKYESLRKLASSDERTIIRFFSPLGLRYRGPRLLELAREIEKSRSGTIPCSMDALLKLRGVGVYVASAVLNVACLIPTPVVDKNVMRVLNRHLGIVKESKGRELISTLYRHGDSRKLSYALIDIGATVCLDNGCACPLREILPSFPLRKSQWRMLRKVIGENGSVVLREQPAGSSGRAS